MRKRIRLNAICSSDNYEEFTKLTQEIKSETKCYVSYFGKLIEISEVEATRIERTVKVIRK